MPKPWPCWWEWELDCQNPHLLKRMSDRSFSETDLREMLAHATAYTEDAAPGRFVIEALVATERWCVIVEPDETSETLVVVTAYKRD